uniref:CDP-diacylglycerol--inositol 3-phosphatidyltransferase n=1 Tax=Ciona savignyi TaxID=51511 RepID=H2ZIJ5_CIOSA
MVTGRDVLLFIPNLIGYARIVFGIASAYYMPNDYVKASFCYATTFVLDEFDGRAARAFNQESKFGAILDLTTDRITSVMMQMMLCVFYPDYVFLFQMSMVIDIGAHWIFMHASTTSGLGHKAMAKETNPILRLYYTSESFLTTLCLGNEFFYSMLYLLHFIEGPVVFGMNILRMFLYLSFPIMATKTAISVMHLVEAVNRLCSIDAADRNKSKS